MKSNFCKLIMVTGDNNNKYYTMTQNGGSTFDVEYGRVESTSVKTSYPLSMWDKKRNEKIKKGYKDVTDLVTVAADPADDVQGKLQDIKDKSVNDFMTLMKKYTDGLVARTYSVKYTSVTQAQIDKAQSLLDKLKTMLKSKKETVNATLVELYSVIPRYMGNVKDHLLPSIKLENILEQEQDNIDAMASQVSMYTAPKKTRKKKETKTLLDILGVEMEELKKVPKDMDYLIKQIGSRKIAGIFGVKKEREDEVFKKWLKGQKNKTVRTLIHGTRCASVVPIIEQGLKIRPAGNFQFSGKAYGDGNYFSEVVQKSLGYTGYDNDKILLVYEVHTGNPFVYDGWYRGNSFSLNYKELNSRGFDSTHVNAGNGLLNSEIIAYKEEQCRLKNIIWLKN